MIIKYELIIKSTLKTTTGQTLLLQVQTDRETLQKQINVTSNHFKVCVVS